MFFSTSVVCMAIFHPPFLWLCIQKFHGATSPIFGTNLDVHEANWIHGTPPFLGQGTSLGWALHAAQSASKAPAWFPRPLHTVKGGTPNHRKSMGEPQK